MAGCNVQIIEERRPCGEYPAYRFTARCACGHEITGEACDPCMAAITPGCLTCWEGGGGHKCRVTFEPRNCRCGCGQEAALSSRSSTRDRLRKGRPNRYVKGHSRTAEVA